MSRLVINLRLSRIQFLSEPVSGRQSQCADFLLTCYHRARVPGKEFMKQRRTFALRPKLGLSGLVALVSLGLFPTAGWAIPGQPLRLAETWIRANQTLNPGPNETFLIQRRSTPAQRFTFEASVFPIAGIGQQTRQTRIRTERFIVVDFINGVTPERLEESLRAIYGIEIFTDFRQAELLLTYPEPESLPTPDAELVLEGELRSGEQFAYWQELAYDSTGRATSGRMAVFLKEDLPQLQEQLVRNRLTAGQAVE
jgi:hypothetical protein